MKIAYCLSGLGADERIFKHLEIPGVELRFIQWLQPYRAEELKHYAQRIIGQIPDPRPVLIGVSFGGMMALEIARLTDVEKVILISSAKSRNELPAWMKLCGALKLYRLLPSRLLKEVRPLRLLRPVQNYFLGVNTPEERRLANEFRDNVDPVYLKWSLEQVFNWQTEQLPPNVFHLHGSRDHIFPLSKVSATHIIGGGGHFMIMDHHREISATLEGILC